MTLRRLLVLMALLLGPALATAAGDRLQVVVSIAPQQWLVEQIGGERVEVAVLVGAGESPATYMPTDAQVTSLMRSNLYFRMGVPFERGIWFDAVSKLGRFEMVDLRQGLELQDNDPHIWLSPRLLRIQAATVAAALSLADPANRDLFEANSERLDVALHEVDSEIRQRLDPHAGRTFFVFHPSWGYFAREYGLRQVAVEIDGKAPSDRELTELRAAVTREGISTIFAQPQIQSRAARALARGIDGRVEILDPLAPDVVTNLEDVAAKLVASFHQVPNDEP